jgi:Tfp pilus assembly protein PilW
MRQTKGFTLLELLVSAAIMIVILGALGGLFATTVRANRTTTRSSEGQQNAEAAIQLLKSEISLAGYRGTDSQAAFRTFSAPILEVTAESSTRDRISVRFFEDRPDGAVTNTSSPLMRTLIFGINSTSELTRKLDAEDNLAVVEGVTSLKVTSYSSLSSTGSVVTSTAMPADRKTLRGITLELAVTGAPTKNVAIALSNPQQ